MNSNAAVQMVGPAIRARAEVPEFSSIPPEVIERHLFQFLDSQGRVALASTSRDLNARLRSARLLTWNELSVVARAIADLVPRLRPDLLGQDNPFNRRQLPDADTLHWCWRSLSEFPFSDTESIAISERIQSLVADENRAPSDGGHVLNRVLEIFGRKVADHAARLGQMPIPDSLLRDRVWVRGALQGSPSLLSRVAPSLRRDRNIVLIATARSAQALREAPDYFREMPQFLLEAVASNSEVVRYAAPALLSDRTFIRQVVARNVLALRFLERRWRADPEIALMAVRRSAEAFAIIDSNLQRWAQFQLLAARENGEIVLYIPSDCTQCEEFNGRLAHAAVAQNPLVTPRLLSAWGLRLSDRCANDLILRAVRRRPEVLEQLDFSYRLDPGLMRSAVEANPAALSYVLPQMRSSVIQRVAAQRTAESQVRAAAPVQPSTFGSSSRWWMTRAILSVWQLISTSIMTMARWILGLFRRRSVAGNG